MTVITTREWIPDEIRHWIKQESFTLIHISKVVLAAILALLGSFAMDLEQPRTALITVAIVMQTHSGMVLSKSYYRLIGSVAGITASIILVGLFAQEPVLFFISMALWIGICTAGSIILRDHQSYAFVLAGYTLCVVGLPATVNPDLSFNLAMNRISEITVGLLCATIVSDLLLPRRMGDVIVMAIQKRFIDFTILLSHQIGSKKNTASLVELMNDIFRLESYQASSALESDASRTLRLKLTQLNREFMSLATTHHTFTQLIHRLLQLGVHPVALALEKVYTQIGTAMRVNGKEVHNEREAAQVLQSLESLKEQFNFISVPESLRESSDKEEFQTGVALLQRFISELCVHVKTYSTLSANSHDMDSSSIDIHFEPMAAALGGLRGALVLLIMALIWIQIAWPSGIEAITMAVVATTLFATSPTPTKTVAQFLMGGFMGALLGYWVNCSLLVEAQDVVTLILAILPGIMIASFFTAKPDTSVLGGGIFIVYLSHLGFGKTYQDNQLSFMNDVLADFIGLLCSSVMYQLMDLQSNSWLQKKTIQSLRQLVVNCSVRGEALRREKFERASRELLYRSGGAHKMVTTPEQTLLGWFYICIEAGHLMINLQHTAMTLTDERIKKYFDHVIQSVANLFNTLSVDDFTKSIQCIDNTLRYLDQNRVSANLPVLTDLRLLKHALVDHQSWLTQSRDAL
ncbi:p-hydroxybenzoic acid efflux pump subunit AaeB [Ferrovum sp. JA12]|uniref:FUSC family protein n=1 Tax=Ferrovum sp. JA12 TaxID=1356299 RepID=UPI0007028365|nr:FUSC family protein [Ferrovum sp. JA12]KRH79740.1 p-hydroxybenzoic acid efflux pump subunit AaeB [Ferrovum sp. JA12]